uniref:Uncharacterized protein n=1 Tax=Anguilla anguilla TaxID=7936 RepID=A0A0E9SDR6_ANGAN
MTATDWWTDRLLKVSHIAHLLFNITLIQSLYYFYRLWGKTTFPQRHFKPASSNKANLFSLTFKIHSHVCMESPAVTGHHGSFILL